MQIMHYLSVFIVSGLLVSCADTEKVDPPTTVKNPSGQLTPPVVAVEEAKEPASVSLVDTPVVAVEVTRLPVTPTPAAIDAGNVTRNSEPVTPVLPTGRLNGVFGTADDLQAYVSTESKILKLKVGDQWEGWRVDSIALDKLIISGGTKKHTLHLNQAIAPEASKQLALQNEYLEQSPPDSNLAETSGVPIRLTQVQREILQKRLLSIH